MATGYSRPALRLDSCQWVWHDTGVATFPDVLPKLSTPRKVAQCSQVHRPLELEIRESYGYILVGSSRGNISPEMAGVGYSKPRMQI